MDWKLGDTNDLKEWIEKLAGASDERRTELLDLRKEICQMKLSFEAMQKKWTTSKASWRRWRSKQHGHKTYGYY